MNQSVTAMKKRDREAERYRRALVGFGEKLRERAARELEWRRFYEKSNEFTEKAKEVALARSEARVGVYRNVLADLRDAAEKQYIGEEELGITGLSIWDDEEFENWFDS